MITLEHYNDGKQKWQSHEVYISEEYFYNNTYDITSHDVFDIIGYGETEEEALSNFKDKFNYVVDELVAFKNLLNADAIQIKDKYKNS